MGVVGAGVEAPDGEEAEAMRVGCREGPDALDDVDSLEEKRVRIGFFAQI